MNLKELKDTLLGEQDMVDIYAKIKRYASEGEHTVMFDCSDITELQVGRLALDGYCVSYNRPCQWYEVSGWK